jgi:hypothetical protein
MHANLDIHISEQALAALSSQAVATGKTPAELASAVVEQAYGVLQTTSADAASARAQFEACFGSVDVGQPIGVANPAIDVDLARDFRFPTDSHECCWTSLHSWPREKS